MIGRVQGKIAVVTGASNGIGREISLLLAREGATVVCSDISPSARASDFKSTHDEITSSGGKAIFHKADVTSESDVEALIGKAVSEYGRVDIVVNNAGIAIEDQEALKGPQSVWDLDLTRFDKTLAINTKGVAIGVKYASRAMKDQEPGETGDRGWIVNTASIMGLVAVPNALSYVTSKHAVIGITKAAALECAAYRIHVNAVCPGFIATDLIKNSLSNAEAAAHVNARHPFGGVGKATDIAKAVLFLASPDNTYMTGANLVVDGGYTAL